MISMATQRAHYEVVYDSIVCRQEMDYPLGELVSNQKEPFLKTGTQLQNIWSKTVSNSTEGIFSIFCALEHKLYTLHVNGSYLSVLED